MMIKFYSKHIILVFREHNYIGNISSSQEILLIEITKDYYIKKNQSIFFNVMII